MMTQSWAESTWEITNYGRFINHFPPNIIRSIRQFERINKKICRQKMSIMFNEICISTYIFTRGESVIVVGNGHNSQSSNPGRIRISQTVNTLGKGMNTTIFLPAMDSIPWHGHQSRRSKTLNSNLLNSV